MPTKSTKPKRRQSVALSEISKRYHSELPTYKLLLQEIEFILSEAVLRSGMKIHQIEARVKTLESLLNKAKEKEDFQALGQLSDIVGARVICLFRSDLGNLDELIRENFEVIDVDDKIDKENDTFGYMSVHYICRMKSDYSGPRYDRIGDLNFEIQARTLCMHAWAVISHYIDYKTDWDVPSELKKSLNALSGLFYVADNEFEQVSQARSSSLAAAVARVASSQNSDDQINLDTIEAYLQKKFPGRRNYSGPSVSEFVQELIECGYKNIDSVDADIDRVKASLKEYEGDEINYSSLGAARISLGLASKVYRNHKYSDKGLLRTFDKLEPIA